MFLNINNYLDFTHGNTLFDVVLFLDDIKLVH